ncbi:hypothetical protein [Sneathiella limimaris]|nr:hypothetical protein [Sneathiella limimaris]
MNIVVHMIERQNARDLDVIKNPIIQQLMSVNRQWARGLKT